MKCLKCLLVSVILVLPCYAEMFGSYWVVFGDKELNLSTRVQANIHIGDLICRQKSLVMSVFSSKADSFELKKVMYGMRINFPMAFGGVLKG